MRGFITGLWRWLHRCKVPKDVAYFRDVDSSVILQTAQNAPITVKPGRQAVDNSEIRIRSCRLCSIFRSIPRESGREEARTGRVPSCVHIPEASRKAWRAYTVSPSGEIDFPVLGDIKVSGMTRSELSGYIKGELMGRELVKDPTVIVDFLSTGISIIGEVNKPGRYDLNRDNINIIEALALAGDLTVDGQRKNVKVVRIEDGNVNTYVLDLTDAASLVKNPAFYLSQNDVDICGTQFTEKRCEHSQRQ